MSLTDLKLQIEAATLVSEKLEQNAKAGGKGGFSRVRSSIRREFSAFKQVLETSKVRLQELEAMQNDLESIQMPQKQKHQPEPRTSVVTGGNIAMDILPADMNIDRPRSSRDLAKNSLKKKGVTRKPPRWLPSAKRKQFLEEQECRDDKEQLDRENDTEKQDARNEAATTTIANVNIPVYKENISRSIVDKEGITLSPNTYEWNVAIDAIHDEFSKDSLDSRKSTLSNEDSFIAGATTTETSRTIEDRVMMLRLAMHEEDSVKDSPYDERQELKKIPREESLAVRERSFRANVQARALAMSRDHSTKSALALRFYRASTENEPDPPDIVEIKSWDEVKTQKGESLTEFSSRLKKSIVELKEAELDREERSARSPMSPINPPIPRVDSLVTLPKSPSKSSIEWPKTASGKSLRNSLLRSLAISPANSPKENEDITKKTAAESERPAVEGSTTHESESLFDHAERLSRRLEKSLRMLQIESTDADSVMVAKKKSNNRPPRTSSINMTNPGLDAEKTGKDVLRIPSKRERSFHTDGWKRALSISNRRTTSDIPTEDLIASQELKAREAYIHAMHEHQSLLKSGKTESSPDVVETQKQLQSCFEKIEYWEKVKTEFNANPGAFSRQKRKDMLKVINADNRDISKLRSGQNGSKLSQDELSNETQELKAREEYIKAMKHHQALIISRVKPSSKAWQDSLRQQKECLAKLSYWEDRNNGLDTRRVDFKLPIKRTIASAADLGCLGKVDDQSGPTFQMDSVGCTVQTQLFREMDEVERQGIQSLKDASSASPDGTTTGQKFHKRALFCIDYNDEEIRCAAPNFSDMCSCFSLAWKNICVPVYELFFPDFSKPTYYYPPSFGNEPQSEEDGAFNKKKQKLRTKTAVKPKTSSNEFNFPSDTGIVLPVPGVNDGGNQATSTAMNALIESEAKAALGEIASDAYLI